LPRWVTSDGLTALGVAGALGTGAAYALSTLSVAWLWAASALLVVQWFGDSLDGTLARVRRAERPRYGYYLDHIVDAFSTAAIGGFVRVAGRIGRNLSALARLEPRPTARPPRDLTTTNPEGYLLKHEAVRPIQARSSFLSCGGIR